jgi:uncharacterized damage-inducible protein DinB
MSELGRVLIEDARKRVVEAYPAQLRAALETLSDDEIWGRPNPSANSVGTLVLHLVGSTRHFLGRGVGGGDYERDRRAEFEERVSRDELERRLEEVIEEARGVLDGLAAGDLLRTSDRVGDRHTVTALLLRVAHHWSMHTGQIVSAAKTLHEGELDELWARTMR